MATKRQIGGLLGMMVAAASAQAAVVEWYDFELGVAGGTDTAQSWSKDGFTLNVTTSDGFLTNIGSGQYTGLWFSEYRISDATYRIDLDGVPVYGVEFEFDACSAGFGPDPERLQDWAISAGGGSIAVSDITGMTVSGSTMSDLVLTSVVNDGMATVTITSGTPFTWMSFHHTQSLNQAGTVIERVRFDTVPTPGAAALLALNGLLVCRRRR